MLFFKRTWLVSAALFPGIVVIALPVGGMTLNLSDMSPTPARPEPVGVTQTAMVETGTGRTLDDKAAESGPTSTPLLTPASIRPPTTVRPPTTGGGSGGGVAQVSNRTPEIAGPVSVTASITENSPPGTSVGAFTAHDPEGLAIAWSLEGTDAALFAINSAGEVTTAAVLDYEESATRAFTVRASDETGASDKVSVTVTIIDVDEPPPAPGAPTVAGVSPTALGVSWQEPENTGPQITDYDVQYRPSGNEAWTEAAGIITITMTIIGLSSDTAYTVRVRARNDEGAGPWSAVGTSSTTGVAPVLTAALTPTVTPETAGGQGIGLWAGLGLALVALAGAALIVVMIARRGRQRRNSAQLKQEVTS